jgi:hypothetical protein
VFKYVCVYVCASVCLYARLCVSICSCASAIICVYLHVTWNGSGRDICRVLRARGRSRTCFSGLTAFALRSIPSCAVLQWCYSGGTVVLRWCCSVFYSGSTMVLQWCYTGIGVVLQCCYSGVTVVLPVWRGSCAHRSPLVSSCC